MLCLPKGMGAWSGRPVSTSNNSKKSLWRASKGFLWASILFWYDCVPLVPATYTEGGCDDFRGLSESIDLPFRGTWYWLSMLRWSHIQSRGSLWSWIRFWTRFSLLKVTDEAKSPVLQPKPPETLPFRWVGCLLLSQRGYQKSNDWSVDQSVKR